MQKGEKFCTKFLTECISFYLSRCFLLARFRGRILLPSVQLLSDEYALMSPETLETHELIMSSQYQRMNILTHPASPEAAKKIAGKMRLCIQLGSFFFCVTNERPQVCFCFGCCESMNGLIC